MATDYTEENSREQRDRSGREASNREPAKRLQRHSSENWIRIIVPSVVTIVLSILTLWMNSQISERAEEQQNQLTVRAEKEQRQLTERAEKEQRHLTKRAEKEQRSRLYTQLLSNREQASSGMRKDMFVTILGGFLSDKPGDLGSKDPRGVEHLDKQLLKLELLALNFGETLSLSPLFAMLDRRIRTRAYYDNDTEWDLDREKLEGRLSSLARRVADAQRSSLAENSDDFTIKVPIDDTETRKSVWPIMGKSSERNACLVLEGIQRKISLEFSNAKRRAKTIDVSLSMQTFSLEPRAPQECSEAIKNCADPPKSCRLKNHALPATKPFTIDRFNLPLIDNSLLSGDQRFALIMRDFNEEDGAVEVVGVLFPGQYAGRRDKLTLDQAIEQLKGDLN